MADAVHPVVLSDPHVEFTEISNAIVDTDACAVRADETLVGIEDSDESVKFIRNCLPRSKSRYNLFVNIIVDAVLEFPYLTCHTRLEKEKNEVEGV